MSLIDYEKLIGNLYVLDNHLTPNPHLDNFILSFQLFIRNVNDNDKSETNQIKIENMNTNKSNETWMLRQAPFQNNTNAVNNRTNKTNASIIIMIRRTPQYQQY